MIGFGISQIFLGHNLIAFHLDISLRKGDI